MTVEPNLRSWVESANQPACDFPIQNLPFGVASLPNSKQKSIVVAIGDQALSLKGLAEASYFKDLGEVVHAALASQSLNLIMGLKPAALNQIRGRLCELLSLSGVGQSAAAANRKQVEAHLAPITSLSLELPAEIGDYTDFYASIFHATNVGRLFRPENPLLPNYKYVPIGYHGRASSIVVSGSPIQRPRGQIKPALAETPSFLPTRSLDYELEGGFFIGQGNQQGSPVLISDAPAHIFGLCLLNDWSARDVQAWEYQPLGPFLAKNFATTISPWVVPMAALEPFLVPAFARDSDDPAPLDYLTDATDQQQGGFDVALEVLLQTETMRSAGAAPYRVSRGNLRFLYWTPAQLLAHHTSGGCNLRPGDLLGTGTVSGPTPDSRGCLLEMTEGGTKPLTLPNGEVRKFLEDGDEVIFRGYCEKPGHPRLGFGECRGAVTAAV